VGVFITVMLAIGAGLALIRGAYNKARVEALREDLVDARAKIEELRGDVRDLEHDAKLKDEAHKLREDALEERCTRLETERDGLRKMVLQRAEVAEVKSLLVSHHEDAMGRLDRLEQALRGGRPS
jgi:DNA repair exonuclease SbcCD ATPase subunit